MGSAEAFNRHYGVWWSLKKALSQFPKDALPKHHFNRDCANNLECADSHRFGVGDWALEMLCGGLDRNNFKTYWLQCHKNQQETTWPNRVNFDGHISCRNCESQTFATPVWFLFTLRISSSSPWNSSISPKLFYCLYWPGSQCCFGVWICCPLAEATWQLAVWFGLPMRFFVIKMPNSVEVFLFDWHLQERRPGHGTEGSLATVKGQTSPTGSRTKEMFLQDHIPPYSDVKPPRIIVKQPL